jgi:hypothetical protein
MGYSLTRGLLRVDYHRSGERDKFYAQKVCRPDRRDANSLQRAERFGSCFAGASTRQPFCWDRVAGWESGDAMSTIACVFCHCRPSLACPVAWTAVGYFPPSPMILDTENPALAVSIVSFCGVRQRPLSADRTDSGNLPLFRRRSRLEQLASLPPIRGKCAPSPSPADHLDSHKSSFHPPITSATVVRLLPIIPATAGAAARSCQNGIPSPDLLARLRGFLSWAKKSQGWGQATSCARSTRAAHSASAFLHRCVRLLLGRGGSRLV